MVTLLLSGELMNTVMDDNKVLTLVPNIRIPLDAMIMVFEINSLKNATPATVVFCLSTKLMLVGVHSWTVG